MEEQKHCEFFGSLEKLEEFTTLTQNIIPGSLVFESLSPFWGYYNTNPNDYNPLYIYLIINRTYAVFDVVRAFHNVRHELGFDLDAAKAFVKFNDRFYNAIRVRHLDGYDRIRDIQEGFVRHGISMLMISDNQKKVTAHVDLKKVFCLSRIGDGLYVDACEKNHAYFEIPKALTFNEFNELTQKVRNNWMESKFDAALGYYLMEQRIVEIVRIYSDKLDVQHLDGIRKLYLQKMK